MHAGPAYWLAAAAAISLVVTLTILSAVERARQIEPARIVIDPPAVIKVEPAQ